MHLGEILRETIESAKPRIVITQYARACGVKKGAIYLAYKNPKPNLKYFAVAVQKYNVEFPKEVMDQLAAVNLDEVLPKHRSGSMQFVPLETHLKVVEQLKTILEEKAGWLEEKLHLAEENLELYRKLEDDGKKAPRGKHLANK